MQPRLMTGAEPKLPKGIAVSGLYLVASLEAVLDDGATSGLLLRLHSYPRDPGREGYWATPNLQFRVDGDDEPPQTPVGIAQAFARYQAEQQSAIEHAVVLLAESFGLRGVCLSLVDDGLCFEVKPSINEPTVINAFRTLRFTLRRVSPGSEANLVDREVRHGFVTIPLTTGGHSKQSAVEDLEENSDGELLYLGKPLISALQRMLGNPSELLRLSLTALRVDRLSTVRRDSGIIAVADFAGYGAILNGTFTGMFNDPDAARKEYQTRVLGTLERSLTYPGTTQVQTVGDGFVAAYPVGTRSEQLAAKLVTVISRWTETVRIVDKDLNGALAKSNNLARLGSRMALTSGRYEWGRINGLESFAPAFTGSAVVEAARLEQALNTYMTQACGEGSLPKASHLLAIGEPLVGHADMLRESLKALGWLFRDPSHDLRAKEVTFAVNRILVWSPDHG